MKQNKVDKKLQIVEQLTSEFNYQKNGRNLTVEFLEYMIQFLRLDENKTKGE